MQKILSLLLTKIPHSFRRISAILYVFLLTWLSLTGPQNLPDLSFFNADKLAHFSAYFGLVVLLYWSVDNNARGRLPVYPVVIAAAWGFLMELAQYLLTSARTFSWLDALANAGGCVLAAWVWYVLPGFLKNETL
jgi:VanZ family protein